MIFALFLLIVTVVNKEILCYNFLGLADLNRLDYVDKWESDSSLAESDKSKKKYLQRRCGRKRPNGYYYPNTKIRRICEVLKCKEDFADEILSDYRCPC